MGFIFLVIIVGSEKLCFRFRLRWIIEVGRVIVIKLFGDIFKVRGFSFSYFLYRVGWGGVGGGFRSCRVGMDMVEIALFCGGLR